MTFPDARGETMQEGDTLDSLKNPGHFVTVVHIDEQRVIAVRKLGGARFFYGILEASGDWVIVQKGKRGTA